jgi:hypothetical protein
MGTWGTGLFSDDTACDVRDEYLDLIGDGLSGPEATERLIEDWKDQITDPVVAPVFWLALAATQWRCGRLEDRTRERAIEVIDSGTDLTRWQTDPKLVRRRRAVLSQLKQRLVSSQPPKKKIPKRFRDHTDWEVGDVVSYRLQSGRLALFRVLGHHTDRGGTSPICELLDWAGEALPTPRRLKRLGFQRGMGEWQKATQFLIGRQKEGEFPEDRIELVAKRTKAHQKPGGYMAFLWSHLDEQLEKVFGLS